MTPELLLTGWNGNPVVILALVAVTLAYIRFVGRRGRPVFFGIAVGLVAFALLSPLDLLASGVLFTAHMLQHLILLLFVPAFFLLSLGGGTHAAEAGAPARSERSSTAIPSIAVLGWVLGVGAMWFWHAPTLCDAAATRPGIHALQTATLLGAGAAFWWPILAPRAWDRLMPGYAIAYLFTACLGCSALGILITLTPVEVCSAFAAPLAVSGGWAGLRNSLSSARDQQIGGLLMWMPMCLVYVAAIMIELAHWIGEGRVVSPAATRKGHA